MGVQVRRRYDREFKLEAVRMVIEENHSVSEVAKDLGISRWALYRWLREVRDQPEKVFPGNGARPTEDDRIRVLELENARLRDDNSILKKALAILTGRNGPP